jgi:predicted nuclease with RNAse H fold
VLSTICNLFSYFRVILTKRIIKMILPDTILKQRIVGINYGYKFSGTTVICYNTFHEVRFIISSKNSDADSFILNEIIHLDPDIVFIDAPLSLPGVYRHINGCIDFFFRKCDREMKATSPMFVGGLTARAMGLKKHLNDMGIPVYETCPRKTLEVLSLPVNTYKQKRVDLDRMLDIFMNKVCIGLNKKIITTWHHFDSLLAFFSGLRYMSHQSRVFGKADEGLVYV